jgi:hypothetical protein
MPDYRTTKGARASFGPRHGKDLTGRHLVIKPDRNRGRQADQEPGPSDPLNATAHNRNAYPNSSIRRFAFTFRSRFVTAAVIGFGFGNRTVASSAWPPCGAASRCGLPGGARDVGGDDVGGPSGRGELAGRLHHDAEGRAAATWAARSGHCRAGGDRRVHWSRGPVGGGKSADRMTGSRQCRCAARRVAGLRGTRKEAGHAAVPWLARHGTGSVPHRGGEADRGCLPQAATRGPGSLSRCAT